MSKVILKGYIVIPLNDFDKVLAELPNHIKLTRQEEGCLVFKVEQDEKDSCRFNVYEEFESEESFEAHQKRVKASQWALVTKNVQRNYTKS